MCDKIVQFFSLNYWSAVGNFFTAVGILSTILAIIRFIHENHLDEWKGNISIKDYPSTYDIESNFKDAEYSKIWSNDPSDFNVIIVFQPVDCIIRKLKVIKLDENMKKVKTIETFKNITPDDAICFCTERAETIPRYKIRWYTDYGKYADHFFSENRRNGINDITGEKYHASFASILRKTIGLR